MWTLAPREWFAQYRTAPALPQPARVTAMAGEPARALVTDQILFFAPLMFLFLLCVRARHSGTARSHAHGESISLSLDTEKSWSKVRVLPWYFSHTYQSRFQMLLECNAALNRRNFIGSKKILRNPDQNDILKGCNPMGAKSLSL